MPVDAGIFNALAGRPRSVMDYMAAYDQQDARKQGMQANALAIQQTQAQMADQARGRQEQEQIRNALAALGGGATDEARIQALKGTGLQGGFSAADALEKSILERQKTAATIGKDRAATAKDEYSLVRQKLEHGVMGLQVAQSPQQAQAMFADGVQKGYWSMQDAQRQAQTIPQDPAQFMQWRQQQLAQILDAAKLLPTIQTRNTGGSTDSLAFDPLTGVGRVTGSVRNTQSPESAASVAAQLRGQDISAGTARRGQDITDKRAKETNDVQRQLVMQEKGLKIAELEDKAEQRARSKAAGIDSVKNQLAVIDKALAHPGRETASGLSGTIDPRNYIPGTDATDFRAVMDQIGGTAFLQAFESLKGGGQITEVEGKKATDAMARLARSQSDKEFKTSLEDLRQVMATGYKRLSGTDYAAPAAKAGAFGDAEKERRYQEWKRSQGQR